VDAQGWPRVAIFGHLARNSMISDNCTQLEDIAEHPPRLAEIIAHLRGLNAFHLSKILAKER
jgi:hypothetical protein